ncbi:MAG: DUF1080 domain-containing protein [Kiritimatiellae bacterium]|nr:DUF1080 domain-containing protein [Kiritimatiellia bacterium]
MKVVVGLAVMLLAGAVCAGEGRSLFNGRDLSGWYTYLRGRGRNVDPKGVFSVTNGVIRVTGREFGALVSEEEFSNYHLSLEYRFLGGEQFGGKQKAAPDSGLLFHSTGPDGAFGGVWMESVEVNLIKGATGDFWGVGAKGSDRIALSGRVGAEKLGRYFIHDPRGTNVFTITGNTRICRSDIARDWQDAITVREADNEKPLGEWNRVELVCSGGDVTVTFNGRIVNRGFNAKPTRGRLQLQSEGCPIEFRNIVISPLDCSERVRSRNPQSSRGERKTVLDRRATEAALGPIDAPCFLVRDVAANGDFKLFDATAWGMTFKKNVRQAGDATCFDLTLTDTTGRDRALTFLYAIPIEDKSEWLADLRTRRPLKGEQMDVTAPPCGTAALSRWPFGAVDAAGRGQALGIDPTAPAFFRVVANAARRCLFIAFDLGFAKEHPTAHFGFCSFAFDGTLGFRGALERYQQLFPEANRVRVERQGVWMPFYPISKVKGWEDFGFRFKEGGSEPAWDDAHDILTFNYMEPCTWWMRIPGGIKKGATVASTVEAAKRLAAEGKDPHARGWQKSAFRTAAGDYVGLLRNTPWCVGTVWSVNSAPGIEGGDWSAKHGEPAFSRRYAGTFPQGIDGEYVDSAELYVTATLDYDRAHFAAMKTPLVFSHPGAQVGIFKGFIAYEYVRGLAERVWPKGRFMMANYTPVSWCWLVPYLDVLGTETDWNPGSGKKPSNWRPMSDGALLYRRALCGGKPYCFLMDTAFERFPAAFTEKFMQRSLAYGMFPGFFSANGSTGHYFSRPELYERDRPLFKKYMPLCRKVAEAGWRPVNRLVATDAPRMVVEQFGTVPGGRYVTVFNLEGQTRSVRFTRLAKDAAAETTPELVTGVPWLWQNDTCTVEIPGETVRVLQM